MEYPFLCSVAISVLQKLDHLKLEDFGGPNVIKKDVEMLKGILSYLPSILETNEDSSILETHKYYSLAEIQKSVFGLHDLIREYYSSASNYDSLHVLSTWRDLVLQLTDFQDHLQALRSKNNLKPLSSISYALPEFEGQEVKNKELPPYLVPCLAYCALYPKSYRIVRETLVNQWMAEGFLDLTAADSSSGDTELEDIGNRYFMELFSMGVFVKPMFCFGGNISNQQEAVTIHSCELHHYIHDFALLMADKEIVLDFDEYDYWDNPQKSPIYLALQGATNAKLPWMLRTCKSFFSHINNDVFESVLKSQCLQVLDLWGTHWDDFYFSNTRFRCRYLAFSGNAFLQRISLEDIDPIIAILEKKKPLHLQTLDVDGCVQLKEVNLQHERRMRHLYYTSRETELMINKSSLRILQFSVCPELRSLSLGHSAPFSDLRILRIYKCPALVSLPDVMDLLIRVEELVFHNCALLDLNLGRSMNSLPKLHRMELIGLPKLTKLPDGLKSSRKALKYLMIADCSLQSTDPVLRDLTALEKLFVYNCPSLSIEPHVFQSLTALQSLDLTLKQSETTFSARDDLWPSISHIPVVILDGQLLHRNANLPRGTDADLGPQTPSFAAQTKPCLARTFPYFILSLEASKENYYMRRHKFFGKSVQTGPVKEDIFEEVARALNGKYKLKPNKWRRWVLGNRAYLDRQRLLYLFLFPSYYEFEEERLVQLWRGYLQLTTERIGNKRFDRFLKRGYIFKSRKDLLTGKDKYKIDVNKVKTDFNELKGRDLYAMLDDESTGMDSSTSWHHVSIVSKNIDERVFETLKRHSELKSVLFIPNVSCLKQIPSSFFTALPQMQALDLSGTHISELSSSIKEMTHLHYLDLSSTLIKKLPGSICQLQELQTLRLRECKHLHALPEGMKLLVNLHHLDFDELGQITSMPEGLGSLTNLCTLSAFIVSKERGCSLRELKGMKMLRGSLCISGLEYATDEDAGEANIKKKKSLRRLHLKWNYSEDYEDKDLQRAKSVADKLEPSIHLDEIQISYYPGSRFPSWMEGCSLNISSITLLRCNFEALPKLEELHFLKHLEIFDLNRVKEMRSGGDHAGNRERYEKLETLVNDGMLRLQCWHEVEEGDYPCLSKLIIRNCPELSELPHPLFTSLKHLEISNCKSLEFLPVEALPRSLDFLMISNCPSLNCDWTEIEDREVLNKWIDTEGEDKGPFKEDIFVDVARALDEKHKLRLNKWPRLATAVRAYFDRQRLLYCCLFANNNEFERETLIQLWMGLLQHPTERVAEKRFDCFLKRGYISKSRKDFLTGRGKYNIDLKKVTTDFSKLEGRDLYAMLDDENTGMDSSTSWHHVSIVSKNIDEKVFQILEELRELRSVLFIPDYGSSLKQIPSSFFTALPYMQALDLSGSDISELPSSVEYMTHLHYLDLSFTLIERLPESICQLQELQTLRLRECKNLHALPKGMKALVNLYHLDFDVLGQLSSMPKGLGCLTKLRTLSAFIVSKEDGCSLRELKGMNKLRGSLCISGLEHATSEGAVETQIKNKIDIERLHLKWDYSKYYKDDDQQRAISVLKGLQPCESLKELQISYYPGSKPPSWMGDASLYVQSITLLNCDFERLPILGGLKNLKHLKIFNLNRVTEMDGRGGRYDKLETLAIDGMLRLKSWHMVEDGDYPCLSKLTISRCSKLRDLPPNFARLPSLKYLELSHCKSLQSLPDKFFQSSLDTLMIINCPLLKKIYSVKQDTVNADGWEKIQNVQNIWVDMKDMKDRDRDRDKDAASKDELIYYDESDEECAETPSTSAEMPSTSI